MARRSTTKRRDVTSPPPEGEGAFTEMVLPSRTLLLFHAAIIAVVGFWIYSPAFHGDWLWDDDVYITRNPMMDDPAGIWKAWFQPGSYTEYYPIEQSVEWFLWHLWHTDTLGYHLTNVFLHIVDALLVWRLLATLRVPLAWVGGLIFVAHPVNVESVAWIVELKNTLSAAPFLLALCAWVEFEEHRRSRDYLLALGFFIAALLCKVSMCTFPIVILLYAWWKRGRIGPGDLLASAPFFAATLAAVKLAAVCAQIYARHAAMGEHNVLPIDGPMAQVALAGLAIAFYFFQFFLPLRLLPMYPLWDIHPPTAIQFLPWVVLAGLAGILWWKRATWGRHVLLGLGYFLVLLLPCLSFGVLFFPRDTWVMDHFLYLPIIGLVVLATAALGRIDDGLSRQNRTWLTAGVTLAAALLAFQAHAYAAAFTNSETLWGYTVERNPGAWTAQASLGLALYQDHEFDEAEAHFRTALQLKPDDTIAGANLASLLAQTGRGQEAIAELRQVLALNPNDSAVLNNLGVCLAQIGRLDEAQREFEAAAKVQPDYADPYNNLGNIAFNANRLDEAEKMYRRAIELRPGYVQAHLNLGLVLEKMNRPADARAEFGLVLEKDPGNVTASQHAANLR